MFGKIKKIFFTGVFGVLYVSFAAQLVYILGWVNNLDTKFIALGFLAVEWLVLIAARYFSKKSSSHAQHNGFNGGRHR
jgi:hypothetical protein